METWHSSISAFQALRCSSDEQRWDFVEAQALRLQDHLQSSLKLCIESQGSQMLAWVFRTSSRNNSLPVKTAESGVVLHQMSWDPMRDKRYPGFSFSIPNHFLLISSMISSLLTPRPYDGFGKHLINFKWNIEGSTSDHFQGNFI